MAEKNNQAITRVCVAVLILSIGGFYLFNQEHLPYQKHSVLQMSLKGYQSSEEKLTAMAGKVSADQKMFLKSLKTLSDISVSEGVKKEDFGKYLDITFKTGTWGDSDQDIMRRLEFENNVRGSNDLNCDLIGTQICKLSKLQVISKHYKDEEKTDKMDIYYSYTMVEFNFDDLNKIEDGNSGMFWNVAKWSGLVGESKSENNRVTIEALGQFFLEYTSAEQDRAFYRKIIDSIDPDMKVEEPKRISPVEDGN